MPHVVQDALGQVTAPDGTVLFERVRYQIDARRRVAVWDVDTRRVCVQPTRVYAAGEVSVKRLAGCPTCQGWVARDRLRRMWDAYDAEVAARG